MVRDGCTDNCFIACPISLLQNCKFERAINRPQRKYIFLNILFTSRWFWKKKGVLPKKIKNKKIYFFNFIIFPLYYPIFKPCKWKLCPTNYWLAYYLIFALLLQANTSWARTNCEYIHIIIHVYVYMCFLWQLKILCNSTSSSGNVYLFSFSGTITFTLP